MRAATLKTLLGLILCLTAHQASAEDATAMLVPHNSYRGKHCASPLKWSAKLATDAQTWANKCTRNPQDESNFAHSGSGGENLAWGTSLGAANAVDLWYQEVGKYDFAKPGFSAVTGHFTQVVWSGSTQLGCGVKRCGTGQDAQDLWVCRYAPPGNVAGQFPMNIKPAKGSCIESVPKSQAGTAVEGSPKSRGGTAIESVPPPRGGTSKFLEQMRKK